MAARIQGGAVDYATFLQHKSQSANEFGFEPISIPDYLYDFQKALVVWALSKGRGALFADCGLGKTPMQLVWSDNVVRHTNKRVLILTPLAVSAQTKREADKFGIEAMISRDGNLGTAKIIITNYERLHYFNPGDFIGAVCDESSILKNFSGATKAAVTEFMRKLPYRLLCTATAAPNDFIELGTSSEAIGELGFSDMLSRFFKKTENTYTRRDEYRGGLYRLRGHAKVDFWRWVCSWARSVRKPSDLGFDDKGFILPPLTVNNYVIKASNTRDGFLFDLPSVGLQEQREEGRRTLKERCEKAAELVSNTGLPAVCWCHLNDEGDLLGRIIPGAIQVAGKDDDDEKENRLEAFATGQARVLVTKPKIAGFGLNWQHCAHQTVFPSHSFEQWYQSVRRSWRFGQKNPVIIDVVSSEGEADVLANLQRKQAAADTMFDNLVAMMNDSLSIQIKPYGDTEEEVPTWL